MITSRQNPSIKDIRRLRRCKGDQVLLEGPHLLRAALEVDLPLQTILVTREFLTGSMDRTLLGELPYPPLEVSPRLLRELADVDSPRGILAVGQLARRGPSSLPHRRGGIYLYTEGLQDPGNLGALARVAEAAGVTGLALGPDSIHPNHPRALRASAGSLLRLPVARDATPEALSSHLQAIDPCWVALLPAGGADLYQARLESTLVVAVGGEGNGLSPRLAEKADVCLTIPVDPPVESLNAAVAAAVAVFEIRRSRTYREDGPTVGSTPG